MPPRWRSGKECTCQCRRCRFNPWVGKIPWRREWQPTPVFLPGECHGQRSMVGYSPWGYKESDMTEQVTHTSNWQHSGKESTCQCRRCRFNPWVRKIPWRRKWQPTCILAWGKNPMNQEAWWATPPGVAKSWTKQLNNNKNNSWIQGLQLCPW